MSLARIIGLVIFLALPAAGVEAAGTADYPTKPVRLIVPYPPAGSADAVARLLAEKLGEKWRERIIVDNRGGAGGIVGTEMGAQAQPDGYTLLIAYVGTFSVNPSVYRKLPYDPLKDFAPVTLLTSMAYLLVVHPSSPAKSVKGLIDLAAARPGLTYASSGNGSAPHLAGALFQSMTRLNLVHVPYKGGGPAMIDLLGGHVQLYFASGPNALPHVRANRLRLLAVTSAGRSQLVPEVPTVSESGLPGYETTSWFGLVAPARTPKAIISKLNGESLKVLGLPDVKERLFMQGVEAVGTTPEAFFDTIRNDTKKYATVVKEAGIRAE